MLKTKRAPKIWGTQKYEQIIKKEQKIWGMSLRTFKKNIHLGNQLLHI